MIQSVTNRFVFSLLLLFTIFSVVACDSEPPTLMKASKQFESDEIRDRHIEYMRTHHMHALKHKRDETMYQGIRTEKHSLNGCINCHVPETYNGKVLRHTDQEHFCTTCHTYVAAKLDCFECHVDHPIKLDVADKTDSPKLDNNSQIEKISKLDQSELQALAFKHVKSDVKNDSIDHKTHTMEKSVKSGGVSFKDQNHSESNSGATNE